VHKKVKGMGIVDAFNFVRDEISLETSKKIDDTSMKDIEKSPNKPLRKRIVRLKLRSSFDALKDSKNELPS